jgi:tRNA threonylcarbamoyladenosine biosynthesis protein TsaB
MILALRTDKPEAELYLYNNDVLLDTITWHAHRELSDTLLIKIDELLDQNSTSKQTLTGIIVYQGPGSFTGLRIGISVANTLSYSLHIPIVGEVEEGWLQKGLESIVGAKPSQVIIPEYGSEATITKPRK